MERGVLEVGLGGERGAEANQEADDRHRTAGSGPVQRVVSLGGVVGWVARQGGGLSGRECDGSVRGRGRGGVMGSRGRGGVMGEREEMGM